MVNDERPVIDALLSSYELIVPEIVLVGAACVLFLASTFRVGRHLAGLAALGAFSGAGVALYLRGEASVEMTRAALFAGPIVHDPFALLIRWIALGSGVLLTLLAWNDVPDEQAADYHACQLLILAGLGLTAAANDLVVLFLALEMISIATYVLLYLPRYDKSSQEAAVKYFLLSVFSSALQLFGFSFLYGMVGTTNLSAILYTLQTVPTRELPPLAAVAVILIIAALGFRLTAVPFHFYAPDVYQGAPTVVAAFLAFVPKVAGFAALLRLLGFVVPQGAVPTGTDVPRIGMLLSTQVPILLWFLAAITMVLGNVLALLQSNLKRLLAYSSVAHAGYMLMALAVAPYLRPPFPAGTAAAGQDGLVALVFYLVAYGAMTIGAFGVIAYLDSAKRRIESVEDLAGLSRSHPGLALLMALFLFSLIGIPLTAGFLAKFLIFFGTLAVPWPELTILFRVLTVIAALNAAIGAWYYLRIVAVMYLRSPLHAPEKRFALPGMATLWLCAMLTLGLSVSPGADWVMEVARKAVGARADSLSR